MAIYDNVVELVAKKNISIQRLEKDAGLANGTIGKWKNRGSNPQIQSLQKVAAALGVTVNRLIREQK